MRPGVASSRRLLAVVLALFVPVAGPLLAMYVRRSRGGKIQIEPTEARQRSRTSVADVNRLGDQPSAIERLLSRDPAERLEAMVHLSTVGDHHAMAALRWTIEHGPQEVVLEAALTLEEIELRHAARPAPPRTAVAAAPAPMVNVPSPTAIATAIGNLVPHLVGDKHVRQATTA